jgi:hypothetical protein
MSAFGQSALHYLVALGATTISDSSATRIAGVDGLPKDLEIILTQWTLNAPQLPVAPLIDQSDIAHMS